MIRRLRPVPLLVSLVAGLFALLGGVDPAAAGVTPPGGLVFYWPYAGAPGRAFIDGRPAQWEGRVLRIRALPARVTMERRGDPQNARP